MNLLARNLEIILYFYIFSCSSYPVNMDDPLLPFLTILVLYISFDSHYYCLVSRCITSHLDYYFLTTHSFIILFQSTPFPIGNLNWSISSFLINLHGFHTVSERRSTPQHGGQTSVYFAQSPNTHCVYCLFSPTFSVLCLEGLFFLSACQSLCLQVLAQELPLL